MDLSKYVFSTNHWISGSMSIFYGVPNPVSIELFRANTKPHAVENANWAQKTLRTTPPRNGWRCDVFSILWLACLNGLFSNGFDARPRSGDLTRIMMAVLLICSEEKHLEHPCGSEQLVVRDIREWTETCAFRASHCFRTCRRKMPHERFRQVCEQLGSVNPQVLPGGCCATLFKI